jgi:hypothetical protein
MDNDTETIISQATSPDTFDVLSFIESTAYPVTDVVVFQAAKDATEYVALAQKRSELEVLKAGLKTNKTQYDAEITDLTTRIVPLGESIAKSSIIFSLRGMPPGIVQEIVKVPAGEEPELHDLDRDNNLIAKTIISVRNAAGVEDTRVWDADAVAKLRSFLKEGEFGKLAKGVGDVNFNAMVFDQATDAGFSGGSSNVAQ